MKVRDLIWSHRYAEAIAQLEPELAKNPKNIIAVEGMAKALRAKGEYRAALPFFERLEIHDSEDKIRNAVAPGRAAWQIDVACLHWLVDDHVRAMRLMHGLVAGILVGSIKYDDAAGGMSQGLLLYYMAITENAPSEISFALDYLRNRVNKLKRFFSDVWPCPVGQYHLGEIGFESVMEAVNQPPMLAIPLDPAKADLGRRRDLCVALFHRGVRSRAQGNE